MFAVPELEDDDPKYFFTNISAKTASKKTERS